MYQLDRSVNIDRVVYLRPGGLTDIRVRSHSDKELHILRLDVKDAQS